MLSVYRDEWGNKTIQTEKRGAIFTIVIRDYMGRVLYKRGHYHTRGSAEIALANMADHWGWRWIGKQENKCSKA